MPPLREDRLLGRWLVYGADPLASEEARPRGELPPHAMRRLIDEAQAHGILPALLRKFPPPFATLELAEIVANATSRYRAALGLTALLRRPGDALRMAAGRLPLVIVKGPVFARTLYPDPALRPYTDIDVLAAPDAAAEIGALLAALGFRLAEGASQDAAQDAAEMKWIDRDNDLVMVEVHRDLVHNPALRAAVTLRYEDIAAAPESPAALLLVALVHGGPGHQYEKLQHLVDVCQATRALNSPAQEACFARLVGRTGAGLAAAAGLVLAGRIFGEPRCFQIADALGVRRGAKFAEMLMDRATMTSTMGPARMWYSWRRQAFRALLKRGGRL